MKYLVWTLGLCALIGTANMAYAAGDVAAGKAKAEACAGCHGPTGQGANDNPKLAGKSEADLTLAMQEYKSGKRSNTAMKLMVRKLSDQDIANLAAYYASLK